MQPFEELRATARSLRRLAALRDRDRWAARCVDTALDAIRSGDLTLRYLGTEPSLFFANACGFIILVSDLGATGVVVGLVTAPADLLA